MKQYSVKRIFRLLMLKIILNAPISGVRRYKLLKYAGVNIKGKIGFIGNHVCFDSIRPDLISIEEGAYITEGCVILTHHLNANQWKNPNETWWRYGEVSIGRNSFLGSRSIICNSVSIGENSIIGAGSVVTKDIPSNEIWGGNPARYIKSRQ